MIVLRASPLTEVLLFLVILLDGSRNANSIRGLVVPSWIGLKKNGVGLEDSNDLLHEDVLLRVLTRLRLDTQNLSLTCVASSTRTQADMLVYPERRHLVYS